MSELQIVLVAEGPTDQIIIEAALKAIIRCPFVITRLQPEETRPEMGAGWGGVLKWCHDISKQHHDILDTHPLLSFRPVDLIILHIDADVSDKSYGDCGLSYPEMSMAHSWKPLPCRMPCPPSVNTCNELQQTLKSWLDPVIPGPKTTMCIPSEAIDTWLLVAVHNSHMANVECQPDPDTSLAQLPKSKRIKKSKFAYSNAADLITTRWNLITSCCQQALSFQQNVQQIVGHRCIPDS